MNKPQPANLVLKQDGVEVRLVRDPNYKPSTWKCPECGTVNLCHSGNICRNHNCSYP